MIFFFIVIRSSYTVLALVGLFLASLAEVGCSGGGNGAEGPRQRSAMHAQTQRLPKPTQSTPRSHHRALAMSKAEIAKLSPFAIRHRSGRPPSRLVIHDFRKGFGAIVRPSSGIVVEYADFPYGEPPAASQVTRNGPDEVVLSNEIEGWRRGLPGMRVGGRRELIVPTRLGDASATTVYVIDLLAVRPGGALRR
jgi:peptidylprolyl isomerase